MIHVDALHKRYAETGAETLCGVTFAVAAGRLAAVLGPSGAGKSTLLRCLAGLEGFDRGAITVGETVVHSGDRAGPGRLRGRVGLVFQSFELFPHLTVLDNCTLAPRRVRKLGRADAEANAGRLLLALGLTGKESSYPDRLSGGQRQRVAIARALAMEPRVLCYDEPTSALDPSLRREVVDTLQRVAGTGVTQVVVTHDVSLARAADLVFVLESGLIAESGPPAKVLDQPGAAATLRLLGRG
jgi:ABC-type polar amino acid transport system ATPase subunit